jgi:multicomponent Na+:H+ antiporter subunit A
MVPGVVLGGMFLLAAACPMLARLWGKRTGYPLAACYALGATALAAASDMGGTALEVSARWVPALGISLTLTVDGLALLFALLVLGIGALVMAYAAAYFSEDSQMGRLYGLLTLFAASMLGLVLAGDIILLFIFWELTSVSSFFLIAGDGGARQKPATQAFLVTGIGGLALLAGLLLMGSVAGTFELSTILASAGTIAESPLAPGILLLVLAGAFTKSAQIPFHFWLRGAMVAPTPVSTYLHAATMVKAGIYLLARLAPLIAASGGWRHVIIFTGLTTAAVAAFQALKQYDLKALLAYSTVSQLGLLTALAGIATFKALVALGVLTLAHALYKSAAFMVVGIVDKKAGTRDLRELSGLRHSMPVTALVGGLAGLSMAGLPFFLGFVSKEEAFGVILEDVGSGPAILVAAALALASAIFTFAYAARLFLGIFGGKPMRHPAEEPARSFLLPAATTALAGAVLGLSVPLLDPFIERVAASATRGTGNVHLTLWHGFTVALLMSVVAVSLGTFLYLQRVRVEKIVARVRFPYEGSRVFDRLYDAAISLGKRVGDPFLSHAPVRHLSWVFVTTAAVALAVWAYEGAALTTPPPADFTADRAITVVIAVACVLVALTRVRLAAVAMLGLVGFLVAVLYVLFGAPDLAITQLLIETLTVTLVVLVFRRLPSTFRHVPRPRAIATGALAVFMGALATAGTYALTGRRELSEAGRYYLEAAPRDAGGNNVVNTILVDFRALDTLGEITVLAVAAVGVFSIVKLTRKGKS